MKIFKKLLLVLSFLISATMIVNSQEDTLPLSLTEKYFRQGFRKDKSILVHEALENDLPIKKISKNAILKFQNLHFKNDTAVISVSIVQDQNHHDIYVYWHKEKEWKILAFCTFRMSGLFYMMLEKYKNMDELAIKAEYEKSKLGLQQKDPDAEDDEITESIGTLDDFMLNIGKMKLTVAPDTALEKHFIINKEKFETLANTVIEKHKSAESWEFNEHSEYASDLNEIMVSSVSNNEIKGSINFTISKIMDNSVGYLFCTNREKLPEMDFHHYILIKPIADNWYLFKKI